MNPFIIIFALTFAAVFPVVLIALIIRRGKAGARSERLDSEQTIADAQTARARIVDARRAGVQRRPETTTFKFLLEVYPGNLQPAFSVAVVWEIEPSAIEKMRPGNFVPVRFDRLNARKVFPDAPGAYFWQRNQHAFLGIDDDFEIEEPATKPNDSRHNSLC